MCGEGLRFLWRPREVTSVPKDRSRAATSPVTEMSAFRPMSTTSMEVEAPGMGTCPALIDNRKHEVG